MTVTRLRSALLLVALVSGWLVLPAGERARAAEAGAPECLSEVEVREAVTAKKVVPQIAALRAARAKAGGEAVRARLCRDTEILVYRITALKRDGRVIRVVVDGASGKVLSPN